LIIIANTEVICFKIRSNDLNLTILVTTIFLEVTYMIQKSICIFDTKVWFDNYESCHKINTLGLFYHALVATVYDWLIQINSCSLTVLWPLKITCSGHNTAKEQLLKITCFVHNTAKEQHQFQILYYILKIKPY
jgi:hypothetical protein